MAIKLWHMELWSGLGVVAALLVSAVIIEAICRRPACTWHEVSIDACSCLNKVVTVT
jgi:hypothetical protein